MAGMAEVRDGEAALCTACYLLQRVAAGLHQPHMLVNATETSHDGIMADADSRFTPGRPAPPACCLPMHRPLHCGSGQRLQ